MTLKKAEGATLCIASVWNDANQLTSIITQSAGIVNYEFDALGHRVFSGNTDFTSTGRILHTQRRPATRGGLNLGRRAVSGFLDREKIECHNAESSIEC